MYSLSRNLGLHPRLHMQKRFQMYICINEYSNILYIYIYTHGYLKKKFTKIKIKRQTKRKGAKRGSTCPGLAQAAGALPR